jgi:hypothetical protein
MTLVLTLQPSDRPQLGDETFVPEVRSGSGGVDIHRADQAHEIVNG